MAKTKKWKKVDSSDTQWLPTSVDAEAIGLESRDRWFDGLVKFVVDDPTLCFTSSGDRMMVAHVERLSHDEYDVTVHDCVITRYRRFTINRKKP